MADDAALNDSDEVGAILAARAGVDRTYQVAPEGRPPLWVGLDLERAAIVEIVPIGDPDAWPLTTGRDVERALVDTTRAALDARFTQIADVLADPDVPMDQVIVYTDVTPAVDVLLSSIDRTGLASRATVLVLDVSQPTSPDPPSSRRRWGRRR